MYAVTLAFDERWMMLSAKSRYKKAKHTHVVKSQRPITNSGLRNVGSMAYTMVCGQVYFQNRATFTPDADPESITCPGCAASLVR